jgi:hypothetical protein
VISFCWGKRNQRRKHQIKERNILVFVPELHVMSIWMKGKEKECDDDDGVKVDIKIGRNISSHCDGM